MTTIARGVELGSESYDQLLDDMRTRLEMAGGEEAMTAMGPEGFKDEYIVLAVEDALDDWNNLPPPIGEATLGNHPRPGVLRLRTMALLLRSQAQRLAVRGIDFNDGGAVVSDTQRSQILKGISDTFNAEYQSLAKPAKMSINAKRGFGASHSEYSYVRNYYGGY